MALVPLSYNVRSLWVRKSSTLLTMCAIAATTAVLAGMLSLQQGFVGLFQERGRDDVAVLLRKGATSEGESGITREQCQILTKEIAEFATDDEGKPLAGAELFLAIRRRKVDGGEANVALRGVQPMTFAIQGDDVRIVEGENFTPGSDELIVGEGLVGRFPDCRVGEVMQINTVPFRVVGVFAGKGGYRSEVWGDLERLSEALERPVRSRVIGKLRDGVDVAAIQARFDDDLRTQPQVLTERQYLASQTENLAVLFAILGGFLAAIMGIAAIFTGVNAMLSAISSRMHEIGILKSVGYRPGAIFASFLFEAVVLGVLGGLLGCALLLPMQGLETGTANQTFSEVTFAFRTTPFVLLVAVAFSAVLGLVGGAFPALRAARMSPTQALRRG